MDDREAFPSSPEKKLDSAASERQRKHAAMIERLSHLHQSRLSRPPPSSSATPSFESTGSFLSLFSDSKASIHDNLARIRATPDPHSEPQLKSDLEKVALSVSNLEKLVAENSYFLPSYEVRTSLKTISDLKQTLEAVTHEVIPRKKFSFKNKSAKTSDSSVANEAKNFESKVEEQRQSEFVVRGLPGFKAKENEVLAKEFGYASNEIREFSLSDLNDCEVRLRGCLQALFIHRLTNCRVYVGPVIGSILIEEVDNSMFVMASHQIRIHRAKGSNFYLRVRSRPIIEDSVDVRFAPYCLHYAGIEKDLEESNLDEETGNWANVDDFRWLRAVQSPNWSVLPENERMESLTI